MPEPGKVPASHPVDTGMVRAVVATGSGGSEVIEVVNVAARPPEPGEVVIEVRAAALNPYDAKVAAGADGTTATPARRLGSEAAGVVIAVGAGAVGLEGDPLEVGDEVFGHRLAGAQASELTVPAERLMRKPPGIPFDQAAGLLSTGTTAVHGLAAIGLRSGETLLLHGASGGVGTLAAQLARLRGARVIGTASARRHDDLRAAGIEPVAYGDGLEDRVRAMAPDGVDAALDTIGTDEALAVSLALLGDPHRFVTIVNFAAALAAGGQAIGGGPGADRGSEIRSAARLELARMLAAGQITVEIAARFPLASARAAYELVTGGHAGGKVILVP